MVSLLGTFPTYLMGDVRATPVVVRHAAPPWRARVDAGRIELQVPSAGRPTIRDVAARAGVSTSTVSRVLDERFPRSDSPSARRVRTAVEELGYRRDVAAASLRRGGTQAVGVLVARLSDPVMGLLFEAIAEACEQRHLFALVGTTHDEPARERRAAEALLQRRVDGLILTTARIDDDFPATLRTREVAHVLALRSDGISPSSVGDDELGGYLATRHLIDLGHRRIGLVAGPGHAVSARNRRAGYERALREAAIHPAPELVRASTFGMESGQVEGAALLGQAEPPTAVFAVNDHTAVGVLAAAAALGLRVPDDVSVVGYNDIPLAERLPTPLTSVRVPLGQIAVDAVELLLDAIAGRPAELRTVTPSLIPRRSSAPPPGP